MSAPRIAKFDTSATIYYSDGTTLFNGFFLIGAALPTVSGTAFTSLYYGNSGVAPRISKWVKVPVSEGKFHTSVGLFYNADIVPPATVYYAWAYLGGTSGGAARQLAGPSASFSVTSDVITVPSLTITIPTAGAVPDPDAASVASTAPTQITLTFYSPSETPNDVLTSFTFAGIPQFVLYNGQVRLEGTGYSRTGFVISLLDDAGAVFAPETGATIKALL